MQIDMRARLVLERRVALLSTGAGNADRHAREYNGHAPSSVVVSSRAPMHSIDKENADMFVVECVKVMIGIKLLYKTA